jgi:hypothetical protein
MVELTFEVPGALHMFKRLLRTLTVLAVATGIPAAATATATADTAVGPNQYFIGSVNSHTDSAVIQVSCPGTSTTGYPMPNQTVGVSLLSPPAPATAGYTGGSSSISAWLDWPGNNGPLPDPVHLFNSYGTVPLTAGSPVPCSGTGDMEFLGWPVSQGVKVMKVQITFVRVTG